MPELTIGTTLPDPVLSNIAIQSATGGPFIADQLMPVRTVGKDLYRITKWGRENITPDVSVKRAFGSPANRTSFGISYKTGGMSFDRSLTIPITDQARDNSPNSAALEAKRTETIMTRLRLDIELDIKAQVLAIANTTGVTVGWDQANAVIEKDLDLAKELFVLQFGLEPNTLLVPVPVRRVIKRDPVIRDLRKYTDPGLLIDGDLPNEIFGLNIITPRTVMKTAAAAAIKRVWDMKNVTLMYIDPNSPDEDTNSWGLQVRSPVATGLQIAAFKWRDPDPTVQADYVAAAIKQNEDIVNSALALTILSVIS